MCLLNCILQAEMPRHEAEGDRTNQKVEVADKNTGKRVKVNLWNVQIPTSKTGSQVELLDVSTNPMKGSADASLNVNSLRQIRVIIV